TAARSADADHEEGASPTADEGITAIVPRSRSDTTRPGTSPSSIVSGSTISSISLSPHRYTPTSERPFPAGQTAITVSPGRAARHASSSSAPTETAGRLSENARPRRNASPERRPVYEPGPTTAATAARS